MSGRLSLSVRAQDYLQRFVSERKQGRSGTFFWDSFLIYSYKSKTNPSPADLYAWLQEELPEPEKDRNELEALAQDYERVGNMLAIWDQPDAELGTASPQYDERRRQLMQLVAQDAVAGGLPLGYIKSSDPSGSPTLCSLPPGLRLKFPHQLLIGSKGAGKTELILQMLTHDIRSNDRAVVAIDVDGSLTERLQSWAQAQPDAEQLLHRLMVLDPAGGEKNLSYNPLELPEDGNLQNAVSAIVDAFKTMLKEPPGAQSQWNAQSQNILRNSILLLMANKKTIADMPALLSDNDVRDLLLEALEKNKDERPEYQPLLDVWRQYKRLARTDQWIVWSEPILNRIAPSLADPRIRPFLVASPSSINFRNIIISRKILVAKLAQENFNENAVLLSSLLVTGLKRAAEGLRTEITGTNSNNRNVSLYVDGLERVVSAETIESITDNTTKLQIGLIASIARLSVLGRNLGLPSGLDQFEEHIRVVRNFGCVAAFAVEAADAQVLASAFMPVRASVMGKPEPDPANVEKLMNQELRHYMWLHKELRATPLQLCVSGQSTDPLT